MSETIPFEEEAVKEYLNKCIRYWRKQPPKDPDFALEYIDAYQNIRAALFGEKLPLEEK